MENENIMITMTEEHSEILIENNHEETTQIDHECIKTDKEILPKYLKNIQDFEYLFYR